MCLKHTVDLSCACVAQACVPARRPPPAGATSLDVLAMEVVDDAEPAVETKNADPHTHAPLDSDGESTPKSSKRNKSPLSPQAPRIRRGQGFAPVFLDAVEVYSVAGERMQFDTKDTTTGDLRVAVAVRRGVLPSQVQLLCGDLEVSDETPILSGHLTVAFRCAAESSAFPQMLL